MKLIRSLPIWIIVCCVLLIVTALHWISITKLPVFADESIYIRWAQLIIDDPGQYLFFSLNDGKTPLFIWQLVPFLSVIKDPLAAARLVAVLGGLFQVMVMVLLVRELKGGKVAQVLVAAFTAFLPFWFFHHQMALMDGWLTLWLSLTVLAVLKATQHRLWIAVGGVALGAAFLTKLPAVLFLPSIVVIPFVFNSKDIAKKLFVSGSILAIGVAIFACLKISPAFPQLFFRGSDFLFPLSEVLAGTWMQTIKNIPSYIQYFWSYLSAGVILLFLAGLAVKKLKRTQLLLLICFLFFVLPISIMGKVVYPRYLLPGSIFLTLGAALAAESLWSASKQMSQRLSVQIFIVAALISAVVSSVSFIDASISNADTIPFVSADRTQYLTEWSSGHGIQEVHQLIIEAAKTQKIAVATEGFFGTLPDGILMYLHNENVTNIVVEGVGQPLHEVPPKLIEKKDQYDRLWLVVNSHRLLFDIDKKYLLKEYCRPYNGPCLQLWDMTETIRSTNK